MAKKITYNNLQVTHPALVKEWNYEKNTIKPTEVTAGSGEKVWWTCEKGHDWEAIIYNRTKGNGCPYCAGKRAIEGETDLATLNPELVKEWNYGKNKIKPTEVTVLSHRKVWWTCEKGHDWEAVIRGRTEGNGCPYCAGKRAIEGETDLATLNPELVKEWNYEKNKIKPTEVTVSSHRIVWWTCEKGHDWEAIIYNRARGNGCPYCSGKRAIEGETDLATLNPELVKEWNYEKNKIKPTEVTAGSGEKVWWTCEKGHDWEAAINNRTKGSGCPYCSGRRAIEGETDLATLNPELVKEWNYDKNEIKPTEVTVSSNRKVWWTCEKGHDWEAVISDRINGNGCPYCAGRRAIEGETDLATLYPELVQEWNWDKNRIKPTEVTVSSNKEVWWTCEKGHDWEATIYHRARGNGCPYCAGQRAIEGETDLATLNPELVKEWNYEKNKIKPTEVTAGSGEKVWWTCEKGHDWRAIIYARTNGNGCPYCAGKKKFGKK